MQRWLPAYGKGVAVLILIALSLVVETASCCHRAMGFDASLESTSWQPMGTLDARIPPHNRELRQVLIDMVDQKILTESRPQAGSSGTELALQRPSNRPASSAASPLRKRNTSKEGRSQRGSHATRAPSTNSSNSSSASKNTSPTTPRVARRSHRLSIRSRAANFSRSRTAAKSEKPAAAPVNPFTDPQQSPKTAAPKPPVAKNFPLPRIDPSTPTGKTTRANLPPLTSGQQRLRSKVRRVLTQYYNRPLNTRDRSPWEVLHAILTYEIHSKVLRGGPRGEPITAVGWLCFNQPCKRRTLMYVDKKGGLQVRVGPGLQGHRGQLLAMLAQAHVKKEYPMRVDGHDFTVADLIEMEKRTCYPRTELTFKLIGLMNYLDSDAQWMNDQGLQWNIPKLISEELQQPVRGAACGGTHRLTGLTLAYKKRLQRGEPLDGEYQKPRNSSPAINTMPIDFRIAMAALAPNGSAARAVRKASIAG